MSVALNHEVDQETRELLNEASKFAPPKKFEKPANMEPGVVSSSEIDKELEKWEDKLTTYMSFSKKKV